MEPLSFTEPLSTFSPTLDGPNRPLVIVCNDSGSGDAPRVSEPQTKTSPPEPGNSPAVPPDWPRATIVLTSLNVGLFVLMALAQCRMFEFSPHVLMMWHRIMPPAHSTSGAGDGSGRGNELLLATLVGETGLVPCHSQFPRGVTRLPLYVLASPARVYDNRRVVKRAPGGTTSEYHPRCFPHRSPAMIMTQEEAFLKAHQQLHDLIAFAQQASHDRLRIDQVERGLFSRLLQLGLSLLTAFVATGRQR